MKKLLVCILAVMPLLFVSCKKDDKSNVQEPKNDVGEERIVQVGYTVAHIDYWDFVEIQDGSMSCIFSDGYVASVGAVNSLKEVDYVPTSGWEKNIAIKLGHGYVVKCENRPYQFSRIRFLERIDKGGVIGYRIRIQDNWNPLYN